MRCALQAEIATAAEPVGTTSPIQMYNPCVDAARPDVRLGSGGEITAMKSGSGRWHLPLTPCRRLA
jgi:hypothetical protein